MFLDISSFDRPHRRQAPLADDALDGDPVWHGGRAIGCRQHRVGHLATGTFRVMVYALPGLSGYLHRHDRSGHGRSLLASLQHVRRAQLQGRSAWRAFWGLGNHREHDSVDDTDSRTPRGKVQPIWTQVLNTALGVWLIAAPAAIGYAGSARINDGIFGPLVASIAVIAIWEATRPL